ncbi:MAG: DUF1697 domain-containing protein, partial [Actinobacteria bacterium]
MGTYVVLLRGINLAGRNRVGMGPLRDLLSSGGYDDVRTYVQSGNVVMRSRSGERALVSALHRRLSDAFGFDIGI